MIQAQRLARVLAALLVLSVPVASELRAQDGDTDLVTGDATVLDADVLIVGTQRVILWGLDAPEKTQSCYRDAERWGCYDAAFRQLEMLSSRAEVSCILIGEPDPFNRRYGVCESGGEDINAEMVLAGMALAYTDQSDDYVEEQIEAITNERGLWQLGVEFEEPWVYRKMNHPGGYR